MVQQQYAASERLKLLRSEAITQRFVFLLISWGSALKLDGSTSGSIFIDHFCNSAEIKARRAPASEARLLPRKQNVKKNDRRN